MEGFWVGVFLVAIICAFLPNTPVSEQEWNWAVSSCAANGGFESMRGEGFISSAAVTCRNGAAFKMAKVVDNN